MDCRSCGANILATFKHAIARNECPACGGEILDEESLALIEDIERTIKSEASVREETARNLAMVLVARYEISIRDADVVQVQHTPRPPQPKPAAQPQKVAPPSAIKQAMQQQQPQPQANAAALVQAAELEGISDREREQIFEEVIKKRYNMMHQIQADTIINEDEAPMPIRSGSNSPFTEGEINPVLEQERMNRLAKQQRLMNGAGGGGSFRRGS